MFQRFTERARQVVVLAQDEARALLHGYIGTEHLLLGVLREQDGVGGRALASLDVTAEGVRERVVEIVGKGDAAPAGQAPFTPRAKKVLELSLREALNLGHDYIGTEHIVLGIMREGDGVAAGILKERGLDVERMREAVVEALPPRGRAEATATSSAPEYRRPFPGGRRGRAREAVRLATWSIVLGWALGAATLGLGILIGWAIWG